MPLPDERPRQSVANLIGRFEQQTKRQSIVPSVPPRTSSVTSHHTGDSAKEELKEKREWPPKPKLPIPVATELPPDVEVKPISPEAEAPPTSLVPETVIGEAAVELSTQALSDPAPAIQQESAVPVPKPAPQRQSSLGAAAPSRPPATPSKGSSTAKSTSAAATKTPARTPAKAPPTSFHSTPAPRSMASAAPAKTAPSPAKPRPSSRPSSRTSQRPSTATTPARAKTPSRARSPAGPMRAMSPAITPARAKSPAVSGQPRPSLFAPTAASLAKARSAPDSVPTPVRKSTGPTPASDRLSKPTAASLSKARPPTISPSTRGAKTPTRGTVPTRGSTLKPRVGLVGAKLKERKQQAVAGVTSEPEGTDTEHHDADDQVEHVAEEGHEHEASDAAAVDEPEHHTTDLVHGPEEYEADHGESHEEAHIAEDAGDHDHGEEDALDTLRGTEVYAQEKVDTDIPEVPVQSTIVQSSQAEHESPSDAQVSVETANETHAEEPGHDETGRNAHDAFVKNEDVVHSQINGQAGDDLEAIVTMLESGKPRPISIVSIPDETGEIPDEE